MRLLFTIIAIVCALSSTIATAQKRATTPTIDSVYIKIVECYVPTAAFARYSESSVEFLIPSSDDSAALKTILSSACKEVATALNPVRLLKMRLGRHLVKLFTVNEATQILSVCSAETKSSNKDLYQRFDMFMKTFQNLFDRESDYVWMKYVGSVSTRVAELYDDYITTTLQSKEHIDR
ncbi:MAG: hypothetical protein HYX66_01170 [Ignavibacteria bacterium]|nr:hypothetical protein [Ignavibacteria bacterium]